MEDGRGEGGGRQRPMPLLRPLLTAELSGGLRVLGGWRVQGGT